MPFCLQMAVSYDRSHFDGPCFEHSVELHDSLSDFYNEQLLSTLGQCPARKQLSQPLRFRLCG